MKVLRGSWTSMGAALAALTLFAGGCPSDIDDPSDDGTESADSTASSDGADETNGMSGPVATSSMTSTTTTDSGVDTTAGGMDTAGFITAGSTDDSGMTLPNGQQCGDDSSCDSGYCYMLPMIGGVCSECLDDTNCGDGETCQVDFGLLYAVCGEGGLGVMCSGDEGCGDLTCELVLDTGGLFDITTCSECGESNPCPNKEDTCSPVVDINLPPSGYLTCQAPASQPNGSTCPWDNATMMGNGTPCMSGICAPADVGGFGLITVGVCGECATDADCPMNGTCMPGAAEQSGITGSTCI